MGTLKPDLYNDLIGIEISVWSNDEDTNTQCMDKVDGSGFYHCGAIGEYLTLWKEGLNESFTICEVFVYEETNIISVVAESNQSSFHDSTPDCTYKASNVAVAHPIEYGTTGQCSSTAATDHSSLTTE